MAQQEPEKREYRDAATHEQLAAKLKIASAANPMKDLLPSEGEDPSVKNQAVNIVDASDVISFNGVTTLVPKLAIMQIPKIYENRINNHTPGNKIVGWTVFYGMNRGWITPVEVSREQAAGYSPLAEELTDHLKKNRNLLIATYKTGPISLIPLRELPETEATEEEEKP